ncbi:MAG: D-alanyl-D-alanine carboxypeptidase family protein [Ramlibacter sp.]
MSYIFLDGARAAAAAPRLFMLILLTLAWSLALPAGSTFAAGKTRPSHHLTDRKSVKSPAAKKRAARRGRRERPLRRHALRRKPSRAVEAVRPPRAELPGLKASAAYVIDQDTNEVLLGKNATATLPIASLTKLMTGVVITDSQLPLDEKLTISDADVDRLRHSGSRLPVGTVLTRGQALHLALMSSENRAAHALARTYPGGESAFVRAMNLKARQFGMKDTQYSEPTGLSSDNRSTARDLALLAAKAAERPLLREFSTSRGYELAVDGRTLRYVNSNRLVRAGNWDIHLQKTGYIREAGYNLLVKAELSGRKLIMVFLDSASKVARIRDAELVRRWLERESRIPRRRTGGAR